MSDIFLQLHISERFGRGVPKITSVYGKNAFEFRENSIVVTIPFDKISTKVVDKTVDKTIDKLSDIQKNIIKEIQNDPHITQPQLTEKLKVGKTTIQTNISFLKKIDI